MIATIRLKIQKDITPDREKKILKLKGSLITNGFTDIVYITDEGLDYHINHFTVTAETKGEALEFIKSYVSNHGLTDLVTVL